MKFKMSNFQFINKYRLCFILIFCVLSFNLSANGGGIYAISATMRSADPIFRNIQDITLLSEKLYIRLHSDRADLTVKYILVNNSDKDYTDIDYAFPIDYVNLHPSENNDNIWTDSSLKNLNFQLDGKNLSYQYSEEKKISEEPIIDNLYGSSYTKNYNRRWFYTKLNIKKNSVVTLNVNYSVQTFALGDGDNPSNMWYLHDQSWYKFRYDLSPAKHWGDGIIRGFYVQVDVSDLDLNGDLRRLSPDYSLIDEDNNISNFRVEGLDFIKTGNIYEYHKSNFDLTKAKPINISYLAHQFSSTSIISNYLIVPNEYTIKVSSENKKHPASNISDFNLETAWVPNNSVGDWMEFTFKNPKHGIGGFMIMNGYQKNEETFYNNNRIKKMKIEAKCVGEEEWRTITWHLNVQDILNLSDQKYKPVFLENIFNCDYDTFDFHDSEVEDAETPIEKIKITILEVYPGAKYNDTCISEIFFLKQ